VVESTELDKNIVADLFALLGDDARVLSWPGSELGGGDVDCAVSRLDALWPLRLSDGWRLCQCLQHDVRCRTWVLERAGTTLAFDTLDDPRGLGRDSLPSGLALEGSTELVAPPATRAAYLCSKRIRKRDWTEPQWRLIGELAREDPGSFREHLALILGRSAAALLAEPALLGQPPEPAERLRLRRLRLLRRLRNPAHAVTVALLTLSRAAGRVVHPTGLFVVIAGPDGGGKSTLAHRLPDACGQLFRRSLHLHSRPRVLPRPGALLRRGEGDHSQPHAKPPHSKAVSTALLLYHWFDYLLGSWLLVRPTRTRTGLVLLERGWWDMLVDPCRYRLNPPLPLARLLGRLLPEPDLVLLLEAPPETLVARKSELTAEEIAGQAEAWRAVAPWARVIDVSKTSKEVVMAAREEIVRMLHERAISRLGAGWAALPRGAEPRWLVLRGPRRAARNSLRLYHPVTMRGRIGWELSRLLAGLGVFRLLPRAQAPPEPVRRLLAPHLPPRSTFAVSRLRARERFLALVVENSRCRFVAKLALDQPGRQALEREQYALAHASELFVAPLGAPRIVIAEEKLLLFDHVDWRPRLRPWRLPEPVARVLGEFSGSTGWAHGDCVPWNLHETSAGWTLVDWEEAGPGRSPFFDVFHYFVRSHAHLGKPSRRALRRGLSGRGCVGAVLNAYAQAAALDPLDAADALRLYSELVPDESAAGRHYERRSRRAIASALQR
jgi:hypothetical protein